MKKIIVDVIKIETINHYGLFVEARYVAVVKFRTHREEFKLYEEVGMVGLDGSKCGVFTVSKIIIHGGPVSFHDEVTAKKAI